MAPAQIPFRELRHIFLDVGNTLISMDYEWIADELGKRGVDVTSETLHRAEAAARPVVSRAVADEVSTEGRGIFALYLEATFQNLRVPAERIPTLVDELLPILRDPGREDLWSFVLPGVPEALSVLRGLGLDLAVVSNSDGSVERVLTLRGLRPYLGYVFDSHLVGYEKPDPRFFEHALQAVGAEPETTLHVGDLYSADIMGGRAAGLHVALVDPFGDWSDADCPRFESLRDVARTVEAARR